MKPALQEKETNPRKPAPALGRSSLAGLLCLLLTSGHVGANPLGMTVLAGAAKSQVQGNTLQITTSQNTFLQWSSFNIAPNETTYFHQPSASSIVFNKITDFNPSLIYGHLQANGVVVLANQNGFYFGPNSFVQAASLLVTTAPVDPAMLGGGTDWSFHGPPPAVPIVNCGHLETTSGGSLFLIAKQVENYGTIQAPGGKVGLVAAQETMISDRPDGLGINTPVRLPAGSVDNAGRILADAGSVLLQAQTVNQSGLIQANSVRQRNGVIELFASESVNLQAGSDLEADGDTSGGSPGGNITIKSDGAFHDLAASSINAAGGANGGHGGNIEISASDMGGLSSQVSAPGYAGSKAGTLTIDPQDIVLDSSGADSAGSGTVSSSDPPASGTLDLNVNTAFTGFSQITLQATRNITLNALWDLPSSTGKDAAGCELTLQAGNDIQLPTGSGIQGGNNWAISLTAGAIFGAGLGAQPGIGSVVLSGSATIYTGSGNLNILAGNNVTVGAGAIRTTGGGSINVTTLSGNVNCGTSFNGFDYSATGVGYVPDADLGGISTMAGGNVTINSGNNVVAFLPPTTGQGVTGDAGAGAFGPQPGNVTIQAAGNVTGHYVVCDGTGTIQATGNAGTSSAPLALSLVKGSWSVSAGNSINLQEVRNPNGDFNAAPYGNSLRFHFDYDPAAAVTLDAGNQIVLSGSSLPRTGQGAGIPVIYPPILTLEAGAGGILLGGPSSGGGITLFPSAEGSLSVTTTGGGDLKSTVNNTSRYLWLSDLTRQQWTSSTDFTPVDNAQNDLLHLNDPVPVTLDISGTVRDLDLISSKPVQMKVDGTELDLLNQPYSILNSSISSINQTAAETTSIEAAGPIRIRSQYTFETLNSSLAAPDLALLTEDPTVSALANEFVYIAATRQLGFNGTMRQGDWQALLNMPVPFVDPSIITALYHDSNKDVPTKPVDGIQIAGGGTLNITAASLDLGTSKGIQSTGIDGHADLASYITRGAAIDIALAGDLDMFSSTILSEYGGAINIVSGGMINIGSQELLGSSSLPRGIISLWGANISVVAEGTVEVNGSRIASYDGGNIFVESLTGDVDAGDGGTGYVLVRKPYVNTHGGVSEAVDTIPGSGILATTYPEQVNGQGPAKLGNITIETPRGNITASKGGIVQVALGPLNDHSATISLSAGSVDSQGKVYVGNIDASGSGVIGSTVDLKATGNIQGLVIASQSADIVARENVSATVLSQGGVTVSAGGSVTGTIAGVGSVDVSGSSVSASLVGGSVTASGNLSGAAAAAVGPAAAVSAAASATSSQAAKDTAQAESASDGTAGNSDDARRKRERPQLRQYVSRVRIITP